MAQLIPRPSLLYSDAQKRADLISWDGASRLLLQELDRGGEGFVQTYLSIARAHQNPIVRAQIAEIVQPGTNVERAVALLGAASVAHIFVYARSIDDQSAYETTLAVWRAASPLVANPLTIALTGRLSLVRDLLDHGSLEARLAGSPIMVDKLTLAALFKKRTATAEERLKVAREVVEKWKATHQHPMPKAVFIGTLAPLFPGVSGRELERVRIQVFPREWREPGRRQG